MREYVLTLLVTAAVTYLLTPLVRRGAIAARAMHAARDRDVHVVPIPLLGGLAMYGGLVAGLMVAGQLNPLRTVFVGSRMASGLLLAGGLLVVVGIVDDRWGLNPISKLAGQVAAGAILVWSGAQLGWLPEPSGGTLILTTNQATALTILVVVATINAVNFIDGLDGLAAGIVCIAALSFFIYYYRLTQVVGLPELAGPALASAVLAGACIGFLPHNFYPAKIFMGDTGAMLLGLLLAYAPISSIASLNYASLTTHTAYSVGTVNRFPEILPLLLPAAILVIPYADLLLAVVRRTRAGLSPFAPDRKHLHHRLLDIGHSHRWSVLIMYLWAALFSGTVVWLSIAKTQLYVLAVATFAAVLALLLMSMPRLRWWERRRTPGHAARPAAAKSAAAKSAAAEPAVARLAVARPAVARLAVARPAAAVRPVGALRAGALRAGTGGVPANAQSAAAQPASAHSAGAQPADASPADASPADASPAGAQRAGAQPAHAQPAGTPPTGAVTAQAQVTDGQPAPDADAPARSAQVESVDGESRASAGTPSRRR